MVKTKWPPFSFGSFENRTNLVEPGPFENWTQKVSGKRPFENRIVRFSNVHCTAHGKIGTSRIKMLNFSAIPSFLTNSTIRGKLRSKNVYIYGNQNV
jgi:hypothetical protein